MGLERDHVAGREPAFEGAGGVADRPPRDGDALASDLHVDDFPEGHGGHRQGHGVPVYLYARDAVLAAQLFVRLGRGYEPLRLGRSEPPAALRRAHLLDDELASPMDPEKDTFGEIADAEEDVDGKQPRVGGQQQVGAGEIAVYPGDDGAQAENDAKDRRGAYARIDAVDPAEPRTVFTLVDLQVSLRSGSGAHSHAGLLAGSSERLKF